LTSRAAFPSADQLGTPASISPGTEPARIATCIRVAAQRQVEQMLQIAEGRRSSQRIDANGENCHQDLEPLPETGHPPMHATGSWLTNLTPPLMTSRVRCGQLASLKPANHVATPATRVLVLQARAPTSACIGSLVFRLFARFPTQIFAFVTIYERKPDVSGG
jgi:hypothetical protein